MGLRVRISALFFLSVFFIIFPTFSSAQLVCGNISPTYVPYQQSQPTTTSFTLTGVSSPQVQIVLENSSGTTVGTMNPTNNGNGNWSFSLNSSTLGLGVTSVEAWLMDASGGNRTFCDAAFVNNTASQTLPPIGACGSAAGDWDFFVGNGPLSNFGPIHIDQTGTQLSGFLSTTGQSVCPGTTISWSVTGSYVGDPTQNSPGALHVSVFNPVPANPPGCVPASIIAMDGTIPFLSCNLATGNARATIPGQGTNVGGFTLTKSCDMPTGESSAFDQFATSFGADTAAGFTAQLQPTSVNFAGRQLKETGTASDSCHDSIPNNGSAVAALTPTTGIWSVTNTNHYATDDYIGYFPAAVYYYRLQLSRITGSHSFSCGTTANQQMTINQCGSTTAFTPYGIPNTLTTTITDTTVKSSRANAISPTITFPQ
jgi:hypothetical protein